MDSYWGFVPARDRAPLTTSERPGMTRQAPISMSITRWPGSSRRSENGLPDPGEEPTRRPVWKWNLPWGSLATSQYLERTCSRSTWDLRWTRLLYRPPAALAAAFEQVVARTFDAVVVTVRGPVDARRAGWLLEIVAALVDDDDVVDLAVDFRHLGGDAEVAATVAALADWRGVTVRPPAGGVCQPQSLNPGGTVCGHHGRFRTTLKERAATLGVAPPRRVRPR